MTQQEKINEMNKQAERYAVGEITAEELKAISEKLAGRSKAGAYLRYMADKAIENGQHIQTKEEKAAEIFDKYTR